MIERKDTLTASQVDLVLILLPIISHEEAACALAASGAPLEVAARVLASPAQRRAILRQQQCVFSSTGDDNRLRGPSHDT